MMENSVHTDDVKGIVGEARLLRIHDLKAHAVCDSSCLRSFIRLVYGNRRDVDANDTISNTCEEDAVSAIS